MPPRKSDLLHGRYICSQDMMDAILRLEKDLIKCQNENRKLREKLGLPVSTFKYR